MSSWLRGAKTYAKAKPAFPFYYDISHTGSIAETYLELLGSFIYARKQNEVCSVYDPNGLINASLRYNPATRLLKEMPENTNKLSLQSLINITKPLKFSEIQEYASAVFSYTPEFNTAILQVIQKAAIRAIFDIVIHITADESGTVNMAYYVNTLKDYQKRIKKTALSVYVMAPSFSVVTQFQKAGDPSWNVVSLSKFPMTTTSDLMFRELAEVQIFAVAPAAILDFTNALDRFIYLMQRNPKGYAFFREVNGREWTIAAVSVAPSMPAPLAVAVAVPLAVAAPMPAPMQALPPPISVSALRSTPVQVQSTPVNSLNLLAE